MMNIFCYGVFDLFHFGHINYFKKIKELYPNSYLFVGILNDIEASKYKKKSILDEIKRKELVESCKYVNETTLDFPLIMTEEFMNKNNIDLVVHLFSDEEDLNKQIQFFKIPIKINKFLKLDYDKRISTVEMLNNNLISNKKII